jgi:hypothetical protein
VKSKIVVGSVTAALMTAYIFEPFHNERLKAAMPSQPHTEVTYEVPLFIDISSPSVSGNISFTRALPVLPVTSTQN